jgi:hypothetical protein
VLQGKVVYERAWEIDQTAFGFRRFGAWRPRQSFRIGIVCEKCAIPSKKILDSDVCYMISPILKW